MSITQEKEIIRVKIESIRKKVRCPICNKFTSSIHDIRKPIKSKYLDITGRSCILEIIKKRYCCHTCNKVFTEEINLSNKNNTISNSLKIKIRKDLLDYHMSIKQIAENNHVSDYVVRKELETATSTIPEYQKNLPRVISFDEFKADTKEGKYAFVLNDPIHKKILDILPNRKKEYLIQYFEHTENRYSVEFVISDMYEPYLLVQRIMFPKAKYVVDRFHYIKYIMEALDKVRIKWQKIYGEKSKEYKLLKNKKNVSLLRRYGNDIDWWVMTKRYKNGHMVEILPGDVLRELLVINDEIKRAYQLKELFLDIINHSTYETIEEQLTNFIDICVNSNISEFIEVSGTNNKIKVIKRNAFGYKNFSFYRKKNTIYIKCKSGRK